MQPGFDGSEVLLDKRLLEIKFGLQVCCFASPSN
jgi:hypothetical protein